MRWLPPVLLDWTRHPVLFNTTADGGGSQFLKGSLTCTFWANASLVFWFFRHQIKKLWREGCSHAPALFRWLSSGFGDLLSTLVMFAANGALWRVYYFVHSIIRTWVKIVLSGWASAGLLCSWFGVEIQCLLTRQLVLGFAWYVRKKSENNLKPF